MPAVYASLTVFILFVAIAFAIYVAIYGSQRPFDERVSDLGVKMRVAYGRPAHECARAREAGADAGARGFFRVARRPHFSFSPPRLDGGNRVRRADRIG